MTSRLQEQSQSIPISSPLEVRQSQLSRTGHNGNGFSSLCQKGGTEKNTRWESSARSDTELMPAGWIGVVPWSIGTPDRIRVRPPCSSDHPQSTPSYLVAFRSNPPGSRGASGLPPLHYSISSSDRRSLAGQLWLLFGQPFFMYIDSWCEKNTNHAIR